MTDSTLPLFILYGSATGNAESIAKDLASKYSSKNDNNNNNLPLPFTNIICCESNAFKKKCQSIWENEPTGNKEGCKYGVIVVMSTTGNGDTPENGSRFTRHIKKKTTIDTKFLHHVAYAVLALGDSNYDKFCAAGELVDKKMAECGGLRVRKIAKADEATGLEDVVEDFLENIVPLLAEACRQSGVANDNINNDSDEGKEEKKEELVFETVPDAEAVAEEVATPATTIIASTPATTTDGKLPQNGNSFISNPTLHHGHIVQDFFSISGVTMVGTLYATLSQQQQQQHPSNNEIIGNNMCIPKVDKATLPSLTTSLSTCKFVIDENVDRKHSNEIFSSEIERMTISSASSSNIHYTLNDPYESHILNAKYLTKTSLDGVKEAHEVLHHQQDKNIDENLISAMQKISSNFSLTSTSDNDDNDNGDINTIYAKNGKRVIEMTLSLPDDFTLEYEPGDSIGLIASNSPQEAQFVLNFLKERHGIIESQLISIGGNEAVTLDYIVHHYIDLCSPIKNKKLLVSLAQHATKEEEIDALNLLASSHPIGQQLFKMIIEDQRITIVDILKLFPSCQSISIDGLLEILPRVPPRYYSICSSPLREEKCNSLKVAFSVVDYITPKLCINSQTTLQRRIGGVVTTYLEAICSSFLINDEKENIDNNIIATTVQIFPKPSADFRLPSTMSTPMILVGPGTGIAPFIGFLDHRHAQIKAKDVRNASMSEGTWRGGFDIQEEEGRGDKGGSLDNNTSVGDIDLFFGCRHRDHDWLYEDKMKAFDQHEIISKLHVAFSRDQDGDKKYYVQDMIQENSQRIAEMIVEKGARVFICGDGNSMAKAVQGAIQLALNEYYDVNDVEESKKQSVERMKSENKLLLDIWS